jgi:hypothetical protein
MIRSVLDEIDLQHVRDANPCQSCTGRLEMYRYVDETSIRQEAIDYLEFGVFQGESIRRWTNLNKNKDSRFFGFDSFEGLPEGWKSDKPKGHFDKGGAIPQIGDERVKFIKGWFEDTVPPFAREFVVKNRLVVHLDADLYGSTMLALVYLTPSMSKGTLLIFDEFFDREHEFKAMMDWQRIYKKNFQIIAEVRNYGQICAQLI